ncbi:MULTISPECIES: hypothetical protein [Clostridium]|uniref:hypothetical protein n=1 Tax=Clostridium TaxID=1485 RepID=UPI00242E4D24|nr:hypothetical protein [Clostridium tyrobutyricum]
MLNEIKLITTIEQTVIVDSDTSKSTVKSTKVINTNIVNTANNQVLNPITHQFTNSEVKYGYISLKKSNPLRAVYSPNNPINISINGLTGQGKWHSTQARADGFSSLFSQINDLEARLFNLVYDPITNTLVFTEK